MAGKPKGRARKAKPEGSVKGNPDVFQKALERRLKAPQQVLLRLPPDLIEEIDRLKGTATRNKFIISLIETYIESTRN